MLAGALLGLVIGACDPGHFTCVRDADCTNGSELGTCQPQGWCSFDDAWCSTGQRFGRWAPEPFAGECVVGDETGETDDPLHHAGETSGLETIGDGPGESDGETSGGGSSDGAAEDGSTTSDGGSPQPTGPHVFEPNLAACAHPPAPNPDACEANTTPGYVQIDGWEPDLGGEVYAFLRFDLGQPFEAADVTSVVLRMVAHPEDFGSLSGAVWAVEPFTYESLFQSIPPAVGAEPIAPPIGSIPVDLIVEWTLPPSIVTSSQVVFLGLNTPSDDGAEYQGLGSTSPPQLIITTTE